MSNGKQVDARLQFGRWLCESMQHGEVEEIIENMSSSCVTKKSSWSLHLIRPWPQADGARASLREWHLNLSLYLFIYLWHTLATWTQTVFSTVHSPGLWCGWRVEEKVFDTAQHGFQIPVIHLSRYFDEHFFFFCLTCVIRPLWGKSFSSTFSTSVCHQVDFVYSTFGKIRGSCIFHPNLQKLWCCCDHLYLK